MTDSTSCCRAPSGYCERCDLLLGLPGLHVVGVQRDDAGLRVEVESVRPEVMDCPACGVIAHAHGRQRVELIDAPCFTVRVPVNAVRTNTPAKQKPPASTPGVRVVQLAVTVGFEPTVACTTLAFEASSFGRSDTSPPMSVSQPGPADKFAGRSQPTTTSKVPTRSAIPAARSSIISTSWRRFRQLSGIPLRPYSAPASCP